jgi:adenylate cyclase
LVNVPPAAPIAATDVADIEHWIVEQGLRRLPLADLVQGVCERLQDIGLDLIRCYAAFPTLHPEHAGFGLLWRPQHLTDTLPIERRGPAEAEPEMWRVSPFRHMLGERLDRLRVRLEVPGNLDFPIFDEFRASGGTDYYAMAIDWSKYDIGFGDRDTRPDGIIFSFVTGLAGGFDDSRLALLDRLAPRLALAIRAVVTHEVAGTVLTAYVGRDAGRRVLDGHIALGDLQQLDAVLFFSDLRGFTRLADVVEGREMVAMLNQYLAAVGTPVMAAGGEILKFMGDGVLAVFETGGDADAACARALDATAEVFDNVARLNAARRAADQPVMALDLALHLGEVFYGNVGLTGRMDFTVIGPAVNEASRMEALCKPLERHVLVSERFYQAAGSCRDRLVSVGRHALRDIRGERQLYTLKHPVLDRAA